jgi:hypothetical protein
MTDATPTPELMSERQPTKLALRSGEYKISVISVVSFVITLILSLLKNQDVNWLSFAPVYLPAIGLLAIGIYIRVYKSFEQAAAMCVALGNYAIFGASIGIFFHLFMPRPDPVWNAALLQFDNYFGYHWPDAVEWLATQQAWLGTALSYIYTSSFIQLVFLIVVLAASSKYDRLNMLLLTGMLGLIVTFFVWQAFPNFSMSMHLQIPPEQATAIRLITNSNYGAVLHSYALNGISVIDNDAIVGAVAFPSYHTVLACITAWFAWRTFAFWPLFLVNVAMVPALHIHGAHHILDFVGGVLVFFVAMWLSRRVLDGRFFGGAGDPNPLT